MDQFKAHVKTFIELEDQIKEIKKTVKELTDQKKDLSEQILTFMQESSLDVVNLPSNKKIVFGQRKSKEPINKEYVSKKLSTVLTTECANDNPETLVEKATTSIIEERQTTERPYISIK